ncbi:MAG: hypothetical protein LBP22_05040 [Deltaproteobacteria bacterium]|nr:hypothetical protein [Deltaproteobacteria bacterium]
MNDYFDLNIKNAYIGPLSREFAGFRKNIVNIDLFTEYSGKLIIYTEFETNRNRHVVVRDAIHGLEVIAKYPDRDVFTVILYFPPKKSSKVKKI